LRKKVSYLTTLFEPETDDVRARVDETPQTRNFEKFYPSPNVFRIIKFRKMTWAGHVARIEGDRGTDRVLGVGASGKETFPFLYTKYYVFSLLQSAVPHFSKLIISSLIRVH